ncbi:MULTISPECIES: isoprenyl transferase [Chryseobacterium]|uniref:Isoprenyl transferase n=1 Tax=Chryseobacterium cucumeris TaxID=1813611 RepID=A0ABX9XC56_9FLAO|nr:MULTISPECIES: isoprenyl transferase [Chryseobacterium]TXI89257.1 MAG: isoprenyl transferase [Chryseobacterium sp.]KYH04096.1 di-trans,poly-cis-decaprenylcistransferase [Chryseobacterium cucumeris]MDH5036550.1 isoprenyl transferase [Chryseobacterium cucumeris]QWT85170.1 isoprenyl transferase [Chryseobacterium sp. PCH239]RKE75656.1 undecaprenyl diphosphate synthase [Chryseobacterium sp. AG363]
MSLIKEKINSENLPKHVAIIMDGNGRWAKSRGEERTFGHKNAINAVRNAINACNEINIPYLTLYTFSSENWNRPSEEVNTLMNLLVETLLLEAEEIFSKGLRMHVIGNLEKLPTIVKEQLERVVELTKENTKGNLVLAISYGSQNEILEAVKNISSDVKEGKVEIENINESLFENYLYTKDFPPVDLLIRTSGEIRISNFLLWQIAYAELQFLNVLWPDFTKDIFFQCIVDYQNKERRYGLTGEQVNGQ